MPGRHTFPSRPRFADDVCKDIQMMIVSFDPKVCVASYDVPKSGEIHNQ
jgi:hypothetical protein